MNRLAIETIAAASEAAQKAPIRPEPAVRLALAWLMINNVVTGDEVGTYWWLLTKDPRIGDPDGYCRSRDLTIFVNRCKFLAEQRR